MSFSEASIARFTVYSWIGLYGFHLAATAYLDKPRFSPNVLTIRRLQKAAVSLLPAAVIELIYARSHSQHKSPSSITATEAHIQLM